MSSMAQRELHDSPTALRVLVLDNSPDILELLSTDLKCRGCVVTTASVSAIRHSEIDGVRLIEAAAPDVVAVPYEANWHVANAMQSDPRVRIPFVLTTTNATAVRRLIGRDLIELVGKPYDLDTLYDVIQRSVSPENGDAAVSPRDGDADRRSGNDRRVGARRQGAQIEPELL
jgi:CheY-like chemotaxis protein